MRIAVISLLVVFAVGCSSLRAAWYGKADWKFRARSENPKVEVPIARFQTEHAVFEIWSRSGRYNVCVGPLIFPVWPSEPPILDTATISLKLRIIPRDSTLRISRNSLSLKLKDGRSVPAVSVFVERARPDAKGNKLKFYGGSDPIPAQIPLEAEAVLSLPYYALAHSRLEWYEIQVNYTVDEKQYRAPRIRFRPARDYEYSPIESPFYFGPGKF